VERYIFDLEIYGESEESLLHTWSVDNDDNLDWMIISINTTKIISAQIPVGVLLVDGQDFDIKNKTVNSFWEDFKRGFYEPRVEL
jgi:hypothetical protein